MASIIVSVGQIWRDDCYYLDRNSGGCKRKYVLILATNHKSGDVLTAVFTSKPNGLTETPVCSLGPPRAGYFVGMLRGIFTKPTWVDFSSINTLDTHDLELHIRCGRKTLSVQLLPSNICCAVLRCASQSEDITNRQLSWIDDTIASLNCP
jgi:hypothetical protein